MKKTLAFLTALVMCVSFTACKKSDTSSDNQDSSDTSISSDVSDNTSSTQSTSDANSTVSSSSNKTETNKGIDMNSLKGKIVKMLMWRDLTEQEKSTIKKIESSTQMKIDVTQTNWSNYMTKLSSMVATNDSPDIAIIPTENKSQGCFPLGAATVFQPLNVTKQDLKDSYWDLESMEKYKIKGRYFAFMTYGNWYDCNGIVMYNADMFKDAGLTTPRELWKSGNWNWDTLKSTAQELKKKGRIGYICESYNNLMQSSGVDFVTYNNGTYTSSVTDSKVISAWTFNAEMVSSGAQPAYGTQTNAFEQGLAGMVGTNLWNMRKEASYGNVKFAVDCVPFPSPKGSETIIPANVNLFGVAKGAKNPIGAGVVIKELLNPANNGKFGDVAISANFEDVFNYCTGKGVKKGYKYAIGVVGYTNLSGLTNLQTTLAKTATNQITTVLQQNKSLVDNAVKQVNGKLK